MEWPAATLRAMSRASRNLGIAAALTAAGVACEPPAMAVPRAERPAIPAATVVPIQSRRAGFKDIVDAATGVALSIPTELVEGPEAEKWGNNWSSDDDRFQIDTLNFRGQRSLSEVYQTLRGIKGRRLTQDTYGSGGFVLQGSDGDSSIFYVQVEERGGEVRGLSIVYSTSVRSEMAPIVATIIRSFRAFPDPVQTSRPAAPPPASVPAPAATESNEQLNRLQRQLEELQAKIRAQEGTVPPRTPGESGRGDQVRGEERENAPGR